MHRLISPKLRAMRLRTVKNKHFAYLREARKEMREVSAGQLAIMVLEPERHLVGVAGEEIRAGAAVQLSSGGVVFNAKTKVKYDG